MIPKEIMKLYEKLAFSRGYEEAFRDFFGCLSLLFVCRDVGGGLS